MGRLFKSGNVARKISQKYRKFKKSTSKEYNLRIDICLAELFNELRDQLKSLCI